jgi:hypothetical protein
MGRKAWCAVAIFPPHDEAGTCPLASVDSRQHHPKHHQADNECRINQYPGPYHFIPFLTAKSVLRRWTGAINFQIKLAK